MLTSLVFDKAFMTLMAYEKIHCHSMRKMPILGLRLVKIELVQ